MKKGKFRSLLTVFMLVASVAAYIYINNVDLTTGTQVPQGRAEGGAGSTINNEQLPNEQENPDLLMPDVELIRSIIEKGKENIPALELLLGLVK